MTTPTKPMEFFDCKGRKIEEGDVLKVFHFIGARRKKHYMYKIAFMYEGYLRFAHAHMIYKDGLTLKNSYDARSMNPKNHEIVEGFHNGDFEFRERRELGEV